MLNSENEGSEIEVIEMDKNSEEFHYTRDRADSFSKMQK